MLVSVASLADAAMIGTGLGQSFIQWNGTDWNQPVAAA